MSNTDTNIARLNVGQIAERIVSNELEARGFRVSDLNRDGLSANADLLAAGYWQSPPSPGERRDERDEG